MCFPPEAVPPPVPEDLRLGSPLPDARDDVIAAADGARFRVSHALATESRGPAVLVLPDVRGLFDFYLNLARAFASAGHHAIVIDYFGRTAGCHPRSDDFQFMPHVKQTTPASVQLDLIAGRDHLATITGQTHFVSVGFCFGGSQSYLATINEDLALDGAVSFYGGLDPSRLGVFPRPADEACRMRGPILALYGGADRSITEALRDEFTEALAAADVEHETVIYPDAPHSFFDRSHDDFSSECADAWRRVLTFVRAL